MNGKGQLGVKVIKADGSLDIKGTHPSFENI